ncbi:MAG: FG-GAP repeat domain-containing protein, partial [Gammaproteobacteria bacterium]
LDLIAGNVGLNTKYHASAAEPTLLYAGDLDGDGHDALVEAQYEHGHLYPVRGRSKLSYTFRWLTKKFPTYAAYAHATLPEIFGADRLATAHVLAATELRSGVFRQQADGTFKFVPLPRLAQIAPINAILAGDLTGAGHVDLFVAGNNFGPEPSTGRFDGGVGLLLAGDGRGGFTPLLPRDSGLLVTGETRAAALVRVAGAAGPSLVVARTDGPVLLFTSPHPWNQQAYPPPRADSSSPASLPRSPTPPP